MSATMEWLTYLQRGQWLTHAPSELVEVKPAQDGYWSLGNLLVTEDEILKAQPQGPVDQVRLFHVIHGDWRVASFRRFRPVVYFAAFRSPEVFACLKLAVSSLLQHGCWQWEVVVLTASETVDAVQVVLAPLGLDSRLIIVAVGPSEDRLDWCMARFRLTAHPLLTQAQPLLYLDTDIICDRPLQPFLEHLTASNTIHACMEGRLDEGHPNSAGHWFGWRLMVEDGVPFNPDELGFSAGALGMANAEMAGTPFSLILESVYADIKRADGGHKLAGQDQAFANYVLRKLGICEIVEMSKVLVLHRLDSGRGEFPDPLQAKGLVHFLGASTEGKLAAMRSYLVALVSRPETA